MSTFAFDYLFQSLISFQPGLPDVAGDARDAREWLGYFEDNLARPPCMSARTR